MKLTQEIKICYSHFSKRGRGGVGEGVWICMLFTFLMIEYNKLK